MRILIRVFTFMVISLLVSCNREFNQPAQVIKDCTGTYIRFEGKDFQVCNTSITDPIADNAEVLTSFKVIKNCDRDDEDLPKCMMLHEFEEWVEVQKIKSKL